MQDPMAAILANLESGLAAAESGNDSPLAADILELSSTDARTQEKVVLNFAKQNTRDKARIAP